MIEVLVQMQDTSQPIRYVANNTWCKGGMFCIGIPKKEGQKSGTVLKHPLCNIFRVTEDFGYHGLSSYTGGE